MTKDFLALGGLLFLCGCSVDNTGGQFVPSTPYQATGGQYVPPPQYQPILLDAGAFMNKPSQQTNCTPTYGGSFSCITQ